MAKHTVEVIKPQLQIDEQLPLHEKGWVVQRVGWAVIFLVPLLAALGLFGEGILSSQKKAASNIETQWERFYRYDKEMKVEVHSSATNLAQLALPQAYIKNFSDLRIVPEPQSRKAVAGNIVFYFAGDDNQLITIYAKPETFGSISGTLTVNNQAFPLQHFIYP